MQQTGTKGIQDEAWKVQVWLNFGHNHKGFMHKLESVLENMMHKILQDFEIQTNTQSWPEDQTEC